MIKDLTFKPEVGMVIKGKVVRIIPIGGVCRVCARQGRYDSYFQAFGQARRKG